MNLPQNTQYVHLGDVGYAAGAGGNPTPTDAPQLSMFGSVPFPRGGFVALMQGGGSPATSSNLSPLMPRPDQPAPRGQPVIGTPGPKVQLIPSEPTGSTGIFQVRSQTIRSATP